MEPFLSLVAKDLYRVFGDDISEVNLVFPNRRASLFFTKYLATGLSKPIWQPKVTTINDLMFAIAELKPTDPLLLNHQLYKQYQIATGSQESFDDFFFWGNVMISDFDQVDKYLVDSSKIFANVKDLKEIDKKFDEFDEEHLKALQDFLNLLNDAADSHIRSRYSDIWEKLGGIYNQFTKTLTAQGIAYEGLAYRVAAEKLRNTKQSMVTGKYALVGFNALNSCERILFHHLKRFENALFYWDYDKYYMQGDNNRNEAAMFMADNLKEFPNSLSHEHFSNFSTSKSIKLVASPSNVAQAKLIPDILSNLKTSTTKIDINTALVLPEEQLLLPVLSALPDELDEVNITMGYPIRDTAAYSLIDNLIGLQTNARQSGNDSKFYYRDVQNILTHPYIKQIASDDSTKLLNRIVERKLINIDTATLSINPTFTKIFTIEKSGINLNNYLAALVKDISNGLKHSSNEPSGNIRLELEFLFTVFKALNRLGDVLPEFEGDINPKIYRALFRKAMAEQRVSFSGEPLAGVQLMGFLETRTLDFENVVILSMNDSVLPGVTHKPSFITPSLRFAYGLPDYRHQNAIYAYYFYRLIQRANNIYLVYTDKAEGTRSGEMSRYILQLIMESGLNIDRIRVKFDLGLTPEPTIAVKKTDKILSILGKYVVTEKEGKYLSPTALSSYKNCSLRFFFSKIANIEEPEEMEEAMDERGVGTILHRAVELIYKDIASSVTKEKLEELSGNIDLINNAVRIAFAENYKLDIDKIDDILIGRNALILERIKWMIFQMLAVDTNRVPYSIFSTEQEVIIDVPITVQGKDTKVRIGGRIDRIEQVDSQFRIVDFKTGKYDFKKDRFKSIADLLQSKELDGVFQIFTYAEIFGKISKFRPSQITPNLWFVRNSSRDYTPVLYQTSEKRGTKEEVQSYENYAQPFKDLLHNLVAEIFNPEVDFTQTDKTENCKVCPYSQICGR